VSRILFVRAAAAGENDDRRGDGEVGTVVLANAEDVEADLPRGGVGRQFREGVDSEFHYLMAQVYQRPLGFSR
jgi:hypothetical protein